MTFFVSESLQVPGFSIPKIGQVLLSTAYLAPPSTNQQVKRRLFDTGGFIMSCMIDENSTGETGETTSNFASSLRPGGIGWQMALRVRVLHGKVRQCLLRRGDWDVNRFGIPINQEDLSATLLAFSVNPLSGVEFFANKSLTRKELLDYLALWRYIGWLLGISTPTEGGLSPLDPCGYGFRGTPEDPIIHSRALLESIILHLMHPNDVSSQISNHLLRVGQNEGNEFVLGYLYRCFMCRRIIGSELADALKIQDLDIWSIKHLTAYLLSSVVLLSLRIYTILTMNFEWFKRLVYNRHGRMMKRFYQLWVKENKMRMEALAAKSNIVHKKGHHKVEMEQSIKSQKISLCPFSLTTPLEKKDTDLLKIKKLM